AWPDVRDAEELHDALQSLVAVPEITLPSDRTQGDRLRTAVGESIARWQAFEALLSQGRAGRVWVGNASYWVAAERAKTFVQLFPEARWEKAIAEVEQAIPSRADALLALVGGWTEHAGPVRAQTLADLLGLPRAEVDKTLLRLEAAGAVLRGQFTDPSSREVEWCERRLLARIHRQTLGRL